jgi:hypothetical protein
VRVPPGALTATIQLSASDGVTFSATSLTVFQALTPVALSAEEDISGRIITRTGTQFSPVAAQDTVTFNGVSA